MWSSHFNTNIFIAYPGTHVIISNTRLTSYCDVLRCLKCLFQNNIFVILMLRNMKTHSVTHLCRQSSSIQSCVLCLIVGLTMGKPKWNSKFWNDDLYCTAHQRLAASTDISPLFIISQRWLDNNARFQGFMILNKILCYIPAKQHMTWGDLIFQVRYQQLSQVKACKSYQ